MGKILIRWVLKMSYTIEACINTFQIMIIDRIEYAIAMSIYKHKEREKAKGR